MRIPALTLATACLVLAGCASNDTDGGEDMPMGPGSYRMELEGVPSGPMSPGQMFNVTVHGRAGMSGMHGMASDHIGAHFWNMTHADPAAHLGNATTCAHTGGQAPGSWQAQCTAPMQAGTYHIRSHMRMMDDAGEMHHWWSDEQTFTVA